MDFIAAVPAGTTARDTVACTCGAAITRQQGGPWTDAKGYPFCHRGLSDMTRHEPAEAPDPARAAESLGWVVVQFPADGTIPTDLSSTILQTDLAGACWERDLRADETRDGARWMVCEVAAPKEADQ